MPDNFQPLSRRLFSAFGMWPTTGDRHLAEYFSYGWEVVGLGGRDFEWWRKWKREAFDWVSGVVKGTRSLEERFPNRTTESVADVIVAITTAQTQAEVALDIVNHGCIPNLPDDAIVEVPGLVSGDGIKGVCLAPLPDGIAAMARQQIAIQALSVQAAVTGDRQKALQALLLDPVVDNFQVAEHILEELITAQREYISPRFFPKD